jgi:hypothetical protein
MQSKVSPVRSFARKFKSELVISSAAVVAAMTSPVFAVDGDIDTSKAILYIGGGLAAAALVGGAMFGLVTLIGASKKAQRAGT